MQKSYWVIFVTAVILLVCMELTELYAATSVAKYFDCRKGAMALNFDTELYMGGMIHSNSGYDPERSASRAEGTRVGWLHIIEDCETYGIPVSFNICGHEAVFGDAGRSEVAEIDVYHSWHPDPHWTINTWYSDMPQYGGNYKTVGDLSGYTRSYDLIYGGELTERSMNSEVPFEISYHNFGHEHLGYISESIMDSTFRLGVEYHKIIGSKLTAEAPPWNSDPQSYKYPIYVQNGIYVFNRMEDSMREPYEVIENLWIIPRSGAFRADSDLTSSIDCAINNGYVLADLSHPGDGFDSPNRGGFQATLAYAKAKIESGDLWATTLSEIGRYWEAKSIVNCVTQIVGNKTIVDIILSDYDTERFGIPYLTFLTTIPDGAEFAKITVDYPTTQILNSDSDTVRIDDENVIYTIYLNPVGATTVEIEGMDFPYTDGININKPVLTIDSIPPVNPPSATLISIQATVNSTDSIYTANIIYKCNKQAKDSRIMFYNGDVWDVNIGPFDFNDTIQYYVTVTDNSGRRERSEDKSFTIQSPPDNVAPSIVSVMAKSDTSLEIVFSESMERSSSEDISNYFINNGILIHSVNFTSDTVTLITSQHMEGIVYSLTVTDVEDLAGNPMPQTTIDYQYTELSNLVGFWRFNEGIGTIAADSSGNNNHGILINGPDWTSGRINGALSFDGSNDYVELSDNPSFDIVDEITVAAWLNPADTGDWRTIVSKFVNTPSFRKDLYLFLYNDRIAASLAGPRGVPGIDWRPDVPLDVYVWTHVALTYDGSAMVMYKDGNSVASTCASGPLMLADSSSNESCLIGANTRWGEYFEGIIDEVRIYNRALNAFEIAQLLAPQQMVTVPSVVGMPQSAAESAIISASLTVGTISHAYSLTVPAGDIISQNLPAGTSVVINSAVDLVVSDGPEPITIVYVDMNAQGPVHDGSNWINAYNYLQDAFATEANIDEIWVAKGIYKPDASTANGGGTGDREATFQLVNGVAIYGGFPTGGGSWNDRDPNKHKTILSGDLDDDDGELAGELLLIDPNRSGNSYHVVTGNGTDSTAVLDGFIITGGNAIIPHHHGGGMYNDSGNPTIIRCTFIGNSASFDGGGMYNNNSNPVVNNCIFSGNYVSSEGAGIKNMQSSPTLSLCTFTNNIGLLGGGMSNRQGNPTIANSIFSGNYSEEEGGGIYNTDNSNPFVINCIFGQNHAGGSLNWQGGGGICNLNSGLQVINCTFTDNSGNMGGGVKCDDSNSIMINCIFWNNSASDGNEIALCNNSMIDISYCDVEGGITHVHIESHCVLNWGIGNINSDPCFADVINGDYHLKSAVGRWNPLHYTNGDLNNDGIINILDLERFFLYWLNNGQGIVVDFDQDELVEFKDYAVLMSNWYKAGNNIGEWVLDSVTSPCIDAGNPEYDCTNEPIPNGDRINMGAYGNTKQASMGTQ